MLTMNKNALNAMQFSVSTVLFAAVFALVTSLFSVNAAAQAMPSQEQLEQLQSLPRAQQEALARQYGIDPSAIDQFNAAQRDGDSSAKQEVDVVSERSGNGGQSGQASSSFMSEDLQKEFNRGRSELKPFGYDIFSGEPDTFAPVAHAPIPANYLISVGDVIHVEMFGKQDESFKLTVNRDGSIVLPDVGEMKVAGMTYSLMQEMIHHEVQERLIGYKAAVTMGELRSIQVFIVGEAYKPGAYTVSSLATISQALYVAGGVSDIASLRSVRLMRGGKVASEFDLYDLLLQGDASADKILKSGDVIFIPARGDMVAVKGEVKRPALYELKGDETLEDALEFAGGATDSAYLSSAELRRIVKGKRLVSTVDLTTEQDLNRELNGGDALTIRQVSQELDNSLMVVGAVTRPGYYEWQNGMRINNILRDVRHDLLEQADLGYGLVVREQGPRRDVKILQFDVADAINGVEGENLRLNERDQLVVFSRFETKAEERDNLSRYTLSEQEREYQQRQRQLDAYRDAYLNDVVNTKLAGSSESPDAENEDKIVPLRELFTEKQEEEPTVKKELAMYSRQNLLEPIMQRIQRQRTATGTAPFVSVAGEVMHPGIYPLVENATAEKLLAAAGGLKNGAYTEQAEITRWAIGKDTANTDYLKVNLAEVINGEVNVPLQGRDRLNVLSIPEWQNTYEVTLRGEVRFPGTYAIKRGETLTDVIKRAGGFTDHAFLEGAVFTREELQEQEQKRKEMLAQELQREIASNMITGTGDANQSYDQMRTLLADLMSTPAVGRLIMDLPKVLSMNGSRDVQLKDGDTLHVPSRSDSISIMGEVQMATSYRFDSELTVDDYISRSGGTKEKADTDRIYIVKANGAIEPYKGGSSWFGFGGGTDLGPGDAIVVPLDTTYTESLELWSEITNIIYNSAVAVAAISSI